MTEYMMVIEPLSEEDGGGYMAFFPDLPGCLSDGETPAEAAVNAQDAMRCWLEVLAIEGEDAPQPGSARQEHSRRIDALRNAAKSLLEYNDHAEGRIQELETQLSILVDAIKAEWQPAQSTLSAVRRDAKILIERH